MPYDKAKTKETNDKLVDNIDLVIEYLGLDLLDRHSYFSGCCPIHEGADNESAFQIYSNGSWKCRTHGCEKVFYSTPIGLIRGVLSAKDGWRGPIDSDKIVQFGAATRYAEEIISRTGIKQKINKRPKLKKPNRKTLNLSPENFLKAVDCPAPYYLKRGFNQKILAKFHVGEYHQQYKPMSNRVIVPVFSNQGNVIVGVTGRSLDPKCIVCGGFHDVEELCPDKNDINKFQKWKNNYGFNKNEYLYNFWNAKTHIQKCKKAIVVEGPSEVWKLEEAGLYNSVAIFGADMNRGQAALLASLGPRLITTMMDKDDGGEHAENSVKKALSKEGEFKIQHWVPPANDLGEMTKHEILNWITAKVNEQT